MSLKIVLLVAVTLYHIDGKFSSPPVSSATKTPSQTIENEYQRLTSATEDTLVADAERVDKGTPMDSHVSQVTYSENPATESFTQDQLRTSNEVGKTGVKSWQLVMERVQFVMTSFGFIANVVTLVSLIRNGEFFSKPYALLLKHQSLVDSAVCLMAGTVLVQPSLWTSGVIWLDAFVCLVWHSQAIYWFAVFMSVWNLVFISAERYLAVCLPFSYQHLTLKKVRYAILFLYPFSLIASSLCFVQYKFNFDQDVCLTEFMIPGKIGEDVFYGYAICCLFLYYLTPITAYVVMYSRILYTLKMRTKSTKLAASKVIESASDSMTKAAVALTVIFIFSIGYDLWYYTLGYTGVVPYEMDSPVQKIGVFLAVFNSCVNPCVYAVLMPAYRKSVKKTFTCGDVCPNSTGTDSQSGNESTGTLSVITT